MERWKICKDVRKPEDSRQANSEKAGQDSGFDARGPCRTGKERVGLKAGEISTLNLALQGKKSPRSGEVFRAMGFSGSKKKKLSSCAGLSGGSLGS